jgi:hypothetical protein
MRALIAALLLAAGSAHAGWTTLEIRDVAVDLVQLSPDGPAASLQGTTTAEVASWLAALQPDRYFFDDQLHGALGANTGLRISFAATLTLNAYLVPGDEDFVWYRGEGRVQADDFADHALGLLGFDRMLTASGPLDGRLVTQAFDWSVADVLTNDRDTPLAFTAYWNFGTTTNDAYGRPIAQRSDAVSAIPEPETYALMLAGLAALALRRRQAV